MLQYILNTLISLCSNITFLVSYCQNYHFPSYGRYYFLKPGLYLGGLRGGSFPPPQRKSSASPLPLPPSPPKKRKEKVTISVYKQIIIYIRKIIQVSVHKTCISFQRTLHVYVTFSKLYLKMYQTASQRIFISKNFQKGHTPRPGNLWLSATQNFSPK